MNLSVSQTGCKGKDFFLFCKSNFKKSYKIFKIQYARNWVLQPYKPIYQIITQRTPTLLIFIKIFSSGFAFYHYICVLYRKGAQKSDKMNAKYRYINICFTICGILLLINLHSCSEILESDSIENNKYAEKLKENGHNLFLPVDLRDFFSQKNGTLKYNTKSSFNNNLVMPPLDSILNWNGAVQQNYTNRIVFTQIPIIDSLYSSNFASITRHKEDIGNSKAPVRIFLIEYENSQYKCI